MRRVILLLIISMSFIQLGQCATRDSLIAAYNKLMIENFVQLENLEYVIESLNKMHDEFHNEKEYVYAAYSLMYTIESYFNMAEYNDVNSLFAKTESYINEHHLTCNYHLVARLYTLNCFAHQKVGNTQLSIYYGKKALDIIEEGGPYYSPNKLIHLYMTSLFLENKDYFEANNQINSFINYTNKANANVQLLIYALKGIILHKLGHDVEAEKSFETGKTFILEESVAQSIRVTFYKYLSDFYYEIDELDSVKLYSDKIPELDPIPNEKLNYLQLEGKLLIAQNKFEEAEKSLNEAIRFGNDSIPYNLINIAQTHSIHAEAYYKQSKYSQSISSINKGLTLLKKISADGSELISNKRQYLTLILMLSDCHRQLANYTLSKKYIVESFTLFEDIIDLNIENSNSKFELVEELKSAYGKFIEFSLENKDYNFSAQLSQKIHGYLLKKQIAKNLELHKLNISDAQFRYYNRSKLGLLEAEKELEKTDNNPAKYDSLFSLLKIYKAEIQNANNYFKSTNPLFNLKYSSSKIKSLDQIQRSIKSNCVIIEYFLTDNFLYTILTTSDNFDVFSTPIDSTFIQHIRKVNRHIKSIQSDVTFESYINSAQHLYELMLKKPLNTIKKNITKLYVVPDNEINYIPLDVLFENVSINIETDRYDLLPYLGKRYDISYHYSSVLFTGEDNYLATDLSSFAPSFTSDYSSIEKLERLLHNQEEVVLINDIVEGKIHVDTSASLINLKNSFNDYKIAHLATHATCNDTLPFESKIHMEDGPLYAYEIYNLPHHLDLAVLSACKTGDGALKKGEGLMSLARAFISSGCKSVVTSLWNVNDKNSSVLMKSFYDQLWKGEPVAAALSNAKRDYLKNADSAVQAHPYHWATFIVIGNPELAIFRIPWGELVLILVIVSIISLVFLRLFANMK